MSELVSGVAGRSCRVSTTERLPIDTTDDRRFGNVSLAISGGNAKRFAGVWTGPKGAGRHLLTPVHARRMLERAAGGEEPVAVPKGASILRPIIVRSR